MPTSDLQETVQTVNEYHQLTGEGSLADCMFAGGVTGVAHGDVAGMRGETPVSRFNHTLTEGEGTVYLFGGRDKDFCQLDDCWSFEPYTATLTRLEPMPEGRSGHSAVFWGGAIWVFGGTTDDAADPLNSVIKYTIDKGTWETLDITTPPGGRFAHGAVLLENKLVIFGGNSGRLSFLNDLWSLNLETLKWTEFHVGGDKKPKARGGAVVTVTAEDFYVFGGCCQGCQEPYNDLWKYNFEEKAWGEIVHDGTPPPPLVGHNAVKVGDVWYVYGGRNSEAEEMFATSFHVWELSLKSLKWRKMSMIDQGPSPWGFPAHRYGGASVFLPKFQRVLVTGGYTHSDGLNLCPTSSFVYINLLASIETLNKIERRVATLENAADVIASATEAVKTAKAQVEEVAKELSPNSENKENCYHRAMDPELETAVDQATAAIPDLESKVQFIDSSATDLTANLDDDAKAAEKLQANGDVHKKRLDRLEDWLNELQGLADVLKDAAKPPDVEVSERELQMEKPEETVEEEPEEDPQKKQEQDITTRCDELKPKLRKDAGALRGVERTVEGDGKKIRGMEGDVEALSKGNEDVKPLAESKKDTVGEIRDRAAQLDSATNKFMNTNPMMAELTELYRRINAVHASLNLLNDEGNAEIQEGFSKLKEFGSEIPALWFKG
eukprot:GHVN01053638.1.p1 GENE.GHVN01053638.1~~GHVN01053638.1.p1  ORF type:complete len:680 (-),score=88.83 GHVN01053638.1:944-2938(-)